MTMSLTAAVPPKTCAVDTALPRVLRYAEVGSDRPPPRRSVQRQVHRQTLRRWLPKSPWHRERSRAQLLSRWRSDLRLPALSQTDQLTPRDRRPRSAALDVHARTPRSPGLGSSCP